MPATLIHTQNRTSDIPPTPNIFPSNPVLATAPYRVADVINSSTGFPESPAAVSAFVFRVADGLFDHVATVLDIQTFPNSLLAAQTANQPYYRLTSVYRDHTTMTAGIDFADTLIARMTSLCKEYELSVVAFDQSPGPLPLPPP